MHWAAVFTIGVLTGILVLLVSGGGITVAGPSPVYWDLDMTKYVLSLFVATVLMMLLFWIYA